MRPYLSQLVIGVLGVLIISSEYSTGMIRATLSIAPKRLSVSWALRSVVGVAVYLTLVAISAGFILRNTAGGIASVVRLFIVLPAIAHVLPSSWLHDYLPYLPSNAGRGVVHPVPGSRNAVPARRRPRHGAAGGRPRRAGSRVAETA